MRFSTRSIVSFAMITLLGWADQMATGQPPACGAGTAGANTAAALPSTAAPANAQQAITQQQAVTQQQSQIAAVFNQLLIDVEGLRSTSQSQIQALLTVQQQAVFNRTSCSSNQTGTPSANGQAAIGGTINNANATDTSSAAAATVANSGDATAQPVTLTDAQCADLHNIVSSTKLTAEALREQALADYMVILTPTQAQALLQTASQAGVGNANAASGSSGTLTATSDSLGLSSEQQQQAAAVFSQLNADEQYLRDAAQQQIQLLLFNQQGAQTNASPNSAGSITGTPSATVSQPFNTTPPNNAPGAASGLMPGFHTGHSGSVLDALIQLNLSAVQAADIANNVSNLRVAIQARVQLAISDSLAMMAPVQPTQPGTTVATNR